METNFTKNMGRLSLLLLAVLLGMRVPCEELQTMLDNNYYHAGMLIVVPEDSTWADWNRAEHMVTQDSVGRIIPFIPPFLHSQKGDHVKKVKKNTEKWFSALDGEDSVLSSEGEKMVPEGADIREILEDTAWSRLESPDSSSRRQDVRKVTDEAGQFNDRRMRPVERVVPE